MVDLILSIITTIAASIAAVAASWLAWQTRTLVQTSQEQVQIGQAQTQQALEERYDQYRPLIIPVGDIECQFDSPSASSRTGFDAQASRHIVSLKNSGAGLALDVQGFLFAQEPYMSGPLPSHSYYMQYPIPLEPGHGPIIGGFFRTTDIIHGDDTIGEHPPHRLFAPKSPSAIATRLTLTYRDIFGRKHASIFEYTADNRWRHIDFPRAITRDFSDLRQEKQQQIAPPSLAQPYPL